MNYLPTFPILAPESYSVCVCFLLPIASCHPKDTVFSFIDLRQLTRQLVTRKLGNYLPTVSILVPESIFTSYPKGTVFSFIDTFPPLTKSLDWLPIASLLVPESIFGFHPKRTSLALKKSVTWKNWTSYLLSRLPPQIDLPPETIHGTHP